MKRSVRVRVWLTLAVAVACGPVPTETAVRASELPLAEGVSADGLSARRVGIVRFYSDTARLDAPDRAALNVPLDIDVSTYDSGCAAPDTTVTTVQGLRTTIVPYERVATNPTFACPSILLPKRRRVRVVFGTPGTATLRLVGREQPSGKLFAVERRVSVR